MKKIILITLIFILQSIPSFGNSINGKGLICSVEERKLSSKEKFQIEINKEYLIGLFFDDGEVKEYRLRKSSDDQFEFYKFRYGMKYKTSQNWIYWDDFRGRFHRKHLQLYRYGYETPTHRCNISNNFKDFNEDLLNNLVLFQIEYDEELKENRF